MNLKLVTLFFAVWILFLSVLFLLGKLDKDKNDKNLHHLSESTLSPYRENQSVQERMESQMESRMESPWLSIRRVGRQFSNLMNDMHDRIYPSASVSQREMNFEEEIPQKNTRNLNQKMMLQPAPWEALGTSIPTMED